ncbi:immunoglobulin lambda-1 light chain isoform X3 [Carassius gibelio]|uniref:immunoglobulin lambda-1 light chain isoform X1 n=1 Tax=Carassius gibelio TaxID=101364 RepID=UPI0022790E78|nr:immunoglobulin lambda-1 light chain isoform X1 [Carassius gibelio]XP_052392145.1 immunoglobulin lambda-1 light chain isoform X3 [Carassius gibelio]
MISIFCAFFTLLTCVSGVTVVTQSPVITVSKGETAKLDCNLGTVTGSAARWYKQTPAGIPQYVLSFHRDWSSVRYGSGFSSPKFTSTHSSQTDYSLIINNVDEDDSAVYYCKTWDDSVNEYVFGQGTKLIVNDAAAAAPVLKILRPFREELSSSKLTLVCLINHMSGAFADVRWLVNGNSVTEGVFTGSAEQQPDKKFKMSSYLTLESSEWDKDTQLTCEASAASKTTRKSIKKSDCSD